MTDEEIDRLEAGPEIDALVAEMVMKEKKPALPHDHDNVLSLIISEGKAWFCLPSYDEGDVCKWEPNPFSSHMSIAWPIAESLLLTVAPYPSGTFHAADGRVVAFGNSAPLAICKAALKVIERRKK